MNTEKSLVLKPLIGNFLNMFYIALDFTDKGQQIGAPSASKRSSHRGPDQALREIQDP